MQFNKLEKLKRAVIKEELVALTGDMIKAVILNQFIYWCERTKDTDKFILEEKTRAEHESKYLEMPLQNGWIYKAAEELSAETMLNLAKNTMRRHIKDLIGAGYLNERTNPDHKWDRTMQYRVDLVKISRDLLALGYTLDGYKLPSSKMEHASSKIDNASSNSENASSGSEHGSSLMHLGKSDSEHRTFDFLTAIPEITTQTTTDITTIFNNNTNANIGKKIWDETLSLVKTQIDNKSFDIFFNNLIPYIDGDTLIITHKNDFVLTWVENRYEDLIKQAVVAHAPNMKLRFEVRPELDQT